MTLPDALVPQAKQPVLPAPGESLTDSDLSHNARFLLRAHFTAEQYSGPQMTTGRLSCIASIILEGKLVVIRRRCDGAKLMTTNAAWNFCSDSANSFGAMNPR